MLRVDCGSTVVDIATPGVGIENCVDGQGATEYKIRSALNLGQFGTP